MKFRKGQRVVLASKARKYPEASLLSIPRGTPGFVRTPSVRPTIGVEWVGLTDGHDLAGELPAGSTAGWYTEPGALGPHIKSAKKGVKK